MSVLTDTPALRGQVVGALACQKNSYLRTLEAEVISCTKRPSQGAHNGPKKKTQGAEKEPTDSWLIEFTDSVLFPEGGGQPSDHGTLVSLSGSGEELIPIDNVQREGLRCLSYSPKPLPVGELFRQEVDFERRWDLMQQHTGQHLLSAIMNEYDNLNTVGWGMGSGYDMNYVDLPRKPTAQEMDEIQARCNEVIAQSLPITIDVQGDEAKKDRLPGDYDQDKGVIRAIRIGDIDTNTCCGTHLQQTSHISLIMLGSTQTVHGKNCRLFFACGKRALKLATESAAAVRSMSRLWSSGTDPEAVVAAATRINDSISELKKKEKKLLAEIAFYEVDRINVALQTQKTAWVYREECGLDFFTGIIAQIKDVVKEKNGVVVLVSGQEKQAGAIVIFGNLGAVEALSAQAKEAITRLKGGGKGEKWQGKVAEWQKGEIEVLRKLVKSYESKDVPLR